MKRIFKFFLILSISSTLCSCSTMDVTNSATQNKYMDLYQTSCDSLKSIFSNTRANSYDDQPITEEEINQISNLETLVSYNHDRLIEIEESRIYQEKYERGQQIRSAAEATFLESHSTEELLCLQDFVVSYIMAGTHNKQMLSSALDNVEDDQIRSYMTLSAALVDAYGEETVWQNPTRQTQTEYKTISECNIEAAVAISVIFVGVAINIGVDCAVPWASLITAASTLDSICQLITIHNLWIDCRKRAKK